MSAARPLTVGEPFNPHKMFNGIFIPEAMCQWESLSPGSKLVYGQLCRFAGKDGKAYPSMATLGKRVGISPKQARRYVRELENEEFVRPQRTAGKTSHYMFLWHPAFNATLIPDDAKSGTPPRYEGTIPPRCGSTPLPDMGVKESHIRESVEERKRDLDCPNRKNRDSGGRGSGSNSSGSIPKPPSKCRQYPKLKEQLTKYMRAVPSDRVVSDLMDEAYGATEVDVCNCLAYFYYERGLKPGTENGPRSWSWFLTAVKEYFIRKERRDEVARARGREFWSGDGTEREAS